MSDGQKKAKVIVVGLDGATWDLIKPWIDSGELKNFKKIIENGSWGILKSTVPAMTPPGWTSMVTGVNPGKHGIFDFFYYSHNELHPVTSKMMKSPRVWQILDKHGITSVVVNIPILYPPDKINGVCISGMMAPGLDSEFVYPPQLKEYLIKNGYTIESDPEEWVSSIRKEIYSKGNPEDAYRKIVKEYNREIQDKIRIFLELLDSEDADFGFVVIESTDRVQHYLWDEIGLKYIKLHYQFIDDILGDILKKGDNIILTSDHGFSRIKKIFYINSWLLSQGYLRPKISNAKLYVKYKILQLGKVILPALYRLNLPIDKIVGAKKVSNPLKEVDINASLAYSPAYTSLGIILNPKLDKEKREKLKNQLIQKLNSIKDPETGRSILRAVAREDVYKGPEVKKAPDILLIMEKGYTISTLLLPPTKKLRQKSFLLSPSEGFSFKNGDHHEDGIIALYGQYFKKGHQIIADIFDITPTILYLFDIPIPGYIDGQVITDAIRPEILKTRKVKRGENIRGIIKRLKLKKGTK